MKRFLYIIVMICFFVSCQQAVDSTEENKNPTPEEQPNLVQLSFINKSSYDVSIYYGNSPYVNSSVFCEVPKGKTIDKESSINIEYANTFYFVYNLSFSESNVSFPYFSLDSDINHKSVLLENNKKNIITIDEISKTETKSSFIFLENKTTSDIYFLSSSTPVYPYQKESKFLKPDEVGVYEINSDSTITFDNLSMLKLIVDAEEYSLPSMTYEIGNIYTISVVDHDSKNLTSLKSITPFNIDVQNQIWERKCSSSSDLAIKVIRPRRNLADGYLAACSSKSTPNDIVMKKIDVYGNTTSSRDVQIKSWKDTSTGNVYSVSAINCEDFIEAEDSSCVILAELTMELRDENNKLIEDSERDDFFLIQYNFDSADLGFTVNLSDLNVPYNLQFAQSKQNSFIETEPGVYIISGYAVDGDANNIFVHDLLFKLDSKELTNSKYYVPANEYTTYTDAGKYRTITSVFYNKKDNSLYATEVYDWDSSYPDGIDAVYKSRLLKFDTELNLLSVELQADNMLFSSINGDSTTGKFYICGESYKGGIQKGLLISSANISEGKLTSEPNLYKVPDISYAWFDQVCICGKNIVASGSASKNRNKAGRPIVVSFNEKGDFQWENISYTDYNNAITCFATNIGTYLIHLEGEKNGSTYSSIVSADLLGANTGNQAYLQ